MSKETQKTLEAKDIKDLINKKSGKNIAATFKESKLMNVPYWIPTGSRWLDSIINHGGKGGIPGGHISSIAAVSGAGKSFLALMVAKNAMDMGISVVYFDAEGGVEKDFVNKCGIDIDKIIHFPISSMEKMFDAIEMLLSTTPNKYLFIWDSYAATPSEKEAQGEFDPSSHMMIGPRVANLAMKKLIIPLMERQSTLLVLNQVRDNVGADKWTLIKEPFKEPGGRSLQHAYSLRLWLIPGASKEDSLKNEVEAKIGHRVQVKLKKSRYRTTERTCRLAFIWGTNDNRLADEELWLEAIAEAPEVKTGSWCSLQMKDGSEVKFRASEWMDKLQDKKFKDRVVEVMDNYLIHSYSEANEKPTESIVDEEDDIE
jgi:RecA/RadA recombinase